MAPTRAGTDSARMSRSGDSDSIEARILRRAQALTGGEQAFAEYLDVELEQLAAWCSGAETPPEDVLDKALDVVVKWKLAQWTGR